MSAFVALKRVMLGTHHLRPGRTRHSVNGRDFPPFVSLEIAQYPGDSGFYLLHICANGAMADTYHESIEDAMHQAELCLECKATSGHLLHPDYTNGSDSWRNIRIS